MTADIKSGLTLAYLAQLPQCRNTVVCLDVAAEGV